MRLLLACALVALLGGVARADDFDPTGWTLLANEHVSAVEELEVVVPPFVGAFDQIAIVGIHGSAELVSAEFASSTGKRKEVSIGASLDAEHRSYELRIPKRTRTIWIVLGESTDTNTELAVLGKGKPARSRRKAAESAWTAEGWETLDTVRLGPKWNGDLSSTSLTMFDQLAIVPSEELVANALTLSVDDGTSTSEVHAHTPKTWRKNVPQLVDLTNLSKPLRVNSASFVYAIRGAFEATVTLYGLPHGASASELVAISVDPWVADGWTLIGEDDVDLVDEELAIEREGTWGQVAIVADGDDIHVEAVAVDRKRFALDGDLDASSPSRVFDLTGKRRAIKKVRLQYTKHRLDAATNVKVYAR